MPTEEVGTVRNGHWTVAVLVIAVLVLSWCAASPTRGKSG